MQILSTIVNRIGSIVVGVLIALALLLLESPSDRISFSSKRRSCRIIYFGASYCS